MSTERKDESSISPFTDASISGEPHPCTQITCGFGECCDTVSSRCVADALLPDHGRCPAGYTLNEFGDECIFDRCFADDDSCGGDSGGEKPVPPPCRDGECVDRVNGRCVAELLLPDHGQCPDGYRINEFRDECRYIRCAI